MKNLLVLIALVFTMYSCSKESGTTGGGTGGGGTPEPIPAPFTALTGIFGGQGVGAAVNISDDIMLFFSSDGQSYAWYEDNEIKKTENINKEGGLFEGLAFSSVSSVIDYEEERLIFFNDLGNTYQWSVIDPDMVKGNSAIDTLIKFSDNVYSLWEWGDDYSCPFEGVGALMGFSKEPRGCEVIGDDDDFMWMINDDGDKLVRYTKEDVVFDEEVELEVWRSENVCGGSPDVFPLNTIGASCIYEPEGDDLRELYFSKDGLSMTILHTKSGKYSEVYSLK